MPIWAQIVGVITALVGTAGLGGLVGRWLTYKQDSYKSHEEVAMAREARLEARIQKLEEDRESDKIQFKLDLEQERARCDAEMRLLRHRIRNQRQIINSFMWLQEMPEERRAEVIASIRQQLVDIDLQEAAEAGVVIAQGLELRNGED
jgi:hypothetical protein